MTNPWLKKMWWVPIAFIAVGLLVGNVGAMLLTVADKQVAQAVERKSDIEQQQKENSDEAAAACTVENGCEGQGNPEKYVAQRPFVLALLELPTIVQNNHVKPQAAAWLTGGVFAFLVILFGAILRRPPGISG